MTRSSQQKQRLKTDPEPIRGLKTDPEPISLFISWHLLMGTIFSLMELQKNLQTLIEKAWALHDKISDEIQNTCIGLGGFRPHQSLSNGFAEDPFAERKSLIAIKEALQVIESLLLCLQKFQSQQQAEWQTALLRLEESRSFLLKMIAEHPGRTLNVIQEMLEFLRNELNTVNQNSTDSFTQRAHHAKQNSAIHTIKRTNGIISFFNSCLKVLSYPLNLPKAAGKIAGFAISAAIMVSVIHFHQMGHQHIIESDEMIRQIGTYYGDRDNLHMNSTQATEMVFLRRLSSSPLDVSNGRG